MLALGARSFSQGKSLGTRFVGHNTARDNVVSRAPSQDKGSQPEGTSRVSTAVSLCQPLGGAGPVRPRAPLCMREQGVAKVCVLLIHPHPESTRAQPRCRHPSKLCCSLATSGTCCLLKVSPCTGGRCHISTIIAAARGRMHVATAPL